jgi:hypothetical protein
MFFELCFGGFVMNKQLGLILAGLMLVSPGLPVQAGQKGMGDDTGVGQQAVKPEIVKLSGVIESVKTGPCEKRKGRTPIGAHILLKDTTGKTLNVHLGPTNILQPTLDKLSKGQSITVMAFRQDQMPANHYVAQSLILGNETIQLRDESLRPKWAGGRGRGNRSNNW